MINTDENGARIREFLAYRTPISNSLYSLSSPSGFAINDDFLETVEVMGSNKEFYLQNLTSLMND